MSENRLSVALLRNVVSMVQLVEQLQNRNPMLPGLGCYYGHTGDGKSMASVFAANRFRAYYVETMSYWTRKDFLGAVATSMDLTPGRTVSDRATQIIAELKRRRRPLLIDEADKAFDRGWIELVRDLHDASGASIVLIGEKRLPDKLATIERVHGRVLSWVATEGVNADDLDQLIGIYSHDVEIAADLRAKLLDATDSARYLTANIQQIRSDARTRGLARMDAASWQGVIYRGEPPRAQGRMAR